jgi:hypothetical protein
LRPKSGSNARAKESEAIAGFGDRITLEATRALVKNLQNFETLYGFA